MVNALETAVQAQTAPVLPPTLTFIRGGALSFNLDGITKEYYAPMRAAGYILGVVVDIDSDKRWKRTKLASYEAVGFMGLTAAYAYRDWKDMERNFRPAVAAEQGRASSRVSGWDLRRSENPIIQTAVRRFDWMNTLRLGTDGTFFAGLNWGLIGMALRITVERTLFNQKTSYDKLEILFQNTQLDGFDLHASSKVAKELGNIIQQCQKDHRRTPWERSVMLHYAPLFNAMAEGIVEKEVSMADVTYILGELMTKQLPLEESLALYNGVRVHGLDSLRLQQPARQAAEAEDSAPKKQTITQFADKIIGGNNLRKDSLLMGQRSFGDMLKAQNQMAHSL